LARRARLARARAMIPLHAGTGDPRLDAAASPAVAGRTRQLARVGPRQRIVTPLAADQVIAHVDAPVDRDSPADARAEDHAEHAVESSARSVGRLGEREAVRVVHQPHGPTEPLLEHALERRADQPAGVGVLDDPRALRDRAGNADAHRVRLADRALDERDHRLDRAERALVVARRAHAVAEALLAADERE